MPAAYGYVKGTLGRDGDHVDVFMGPHRKAPAVYVIDQRDLRSGKFDEHKCMCGFGSEKQARAFYERAYNDGRGADRIMSVTAMTVPEFKHWLEHGDTTRRAA